MENKFAMLARANAVYGILQQNDPSADVSLSGASNDGTSEKLGLSVNISRNLRPSVEGASSPYQEYLRLPQEIRGTAEEVVKKLQGFIKDLEVLGVGIYSQMTEVFRGAFLDGNSIPGLAEYFQGVISKYFKGQVSSELEMKLLLRDPVKLVAYSQSHNVAATYDVPRATLILSGFREKALVPSDAPNIGLRIDMVEVQENVLAESFSAVMVKFSRGQKAFLVEERLEENEYGFGYSMNTVYRETSDEVVDNVIQKLVRTDTLDTLQDVIFDEKTVFFCFDPILREDEVEVILEQIKQEYPQATLAEKPKANEASWWVVEINDTSDVAAQVAAAGEQEMSPEDKTDGTIAKEPQTVTKEIADEIDIGKALNI